MSTSEAALLALVEAGRVTWTDPTPHLAARTGWSVPRWHIDGVEAHGVQIRLLDRLSDKGLVEATEGSTARRKQPEQDSAL